MQNVKTKECAECRNIKILGEFDKCRKNRDGYSVWCKDCKKKYRKIYAAKPKKNTSHKTCNSCKQNKPIGEFYKNSDSRDGYLNRCKDCFKKIMADQNSKPEVKKRIRDWVRKYRKTDKGKLIVKKMNQNAQAKGYYKKYRKKPHAKKYNAEWHINKYRTDTTYRLNNLMSKRINLELRGTKSHKRWEELVGYTVGDLKKHLESKFIDGMSWENIGKWHIDHIIPVSFFQFTTYKDSEFKQCWALSNLQPLWAYDNFKKGSKIQ